MRTAAGALLGHIHAAFGSRPTVVQGVQNQGDHSLTLLFTETRAGRPYTGIAIVTVAPGNAAEWRRALRYVGAIPEDRRIDDSDRPHAYGSERRNGENCARSGGAADRASIPDGTGTIGVPSNWTLKSAGGGSALAVGPTGREIAAFNSAQGALDPTYGIGLQMVRGTGMGGVPQMRANAFKTVAFMPYSSDPVAAWTRVFDQMAKPRGATGPALHRDQPYVHGSELGAGSSEREARRSPSRTSRT